MKYSIGLIAMAALFAACSTGSENKITPGGLEFTVHKKGDGVLPKTGQIVVFDLIMKDNKDSVLNDTYKRGLPERTIIADSSALASEDAITQVFRMISKGDSISFTVTTKRFFEELVKQPIPEEVDAEGSLSFGIRVNEVMNRDEFEQFSQRLMEEYRAKQQEHTVQQFTRDTVAIDNFLAEKGIQATKLPSGIRYVITKQGKGPLAGSSQTVEVNYDGYLLNGTHFDTNVESLAKENDLYDSMRAQMDGYQPMAVTIDQSSVIPGWHLALKQLNEGAKGTFYIPSKLAYGQRRTGPIAENSILVFDIEMIDIK